MRFRQIVDFEIYLSARFNCVIQRAVARWIEIFDHPRSRIGTVRNPRLNAVTDGLVVTENKFAVESIRLIYV